MKIFYYFGIIFPFLSTSVKAELNLLNFSLENDSFGFFVDRYYTSGAKLEYQNPNLFSPISYFSKLLSMTSQMNCFSNSCKELNSYSIHHIIFTPALYKATDPVREDRAYAGLAYFTNSSTIYLSNFTLGNQISFGNLGPSSYGKTVQEIIHKPMLFYTPRGWSHELKDKAIFHWDLLMIPILNEYFAFPFRFRLGNWIQSINFGFQARFGQISSKYTFAVHSIQTAETSPYYETEEEEEFYFFFQPSLFYQSKNWSISQNKQTELDYRGVLDDRVYTKMERYFFFNYTVLNAKNYEESMGNFFIFNILFNGLEGLSRTEGRFALEYLRKERYDLKNPNVLLGAYNVLKFNDNQTYTWMKYTAFKEMFNKLQIPQENRNFLLGLLFLQGEFSKSKPIESKLKNYHGELQFGIVYKSKNIFVNFAWTLATLDFETQKSLPNFHGWGRIQLGIYF